MEFRVTCEPAFDYARAKHDTVHAEHGVIFRSEWLTLALSSPLPLKSDHRGAHATFRLREGESAVFVLRQHSRRRTVPQGARRQTKANILFEQTVEYWRRWLSQCQYVGRWRDIVYRARSDAQAPHLRADGRNRRRRDLQPAGKNRRAAQLGLPLHLDPRRGLFAVRTAAARLHLRGGRLHGLARRALPRTTGRRHASRRALRHRRPMRHSRNDPRSSRRLPRIAPRADRQRGLEADSTRHFRRVVRFGLFVQQIRRAHFVRRLEASAFAARLALQELAASRRRHLGSPWREARFRLFAPDVLGRLRSRPAIGRQAFVPRRSQRLARRSATRSTRRFSRAAGPRSGNRSCSRTAANISTHRP